MYVLVKFNKDYADEFDVHGFKVFTSNEWAAVLAQAAAAFSAADHVEFETYFGTNEYVTWDSLDDFTSSYTTTDISNEEAGFLRLNFGRSWGHFLLPDFNEHDDDCDAGCHSCSCGVPPILI